MKNLNKQLENNNIIIEYIRIWKKVAKNIALTEKERKHFDILSNKYHAIR